MKWWIYTGKATFDNIHVRSIFNAISRSISHPRFAACLLCAAVILLPAFACLGEVVSEIGYWPVGFCSELAQLDGKIIWSSGGRVEIWEHRDGELAPASQSHVDFRNEIEALEIAGDLIFVAVKDEGLAVVDISDLSAPVVRSRFGAGTSFSALKVAAGRLYAFQDGIDLLLLLDFQNPDDLQIQGSHSFLSVVDVAVRGGLVFAVGGSGMVFVLDWSVPGAPVLMEEYTGYSADAIDLLPEDMLVVWDDDSGILRVLDVADITQVAELGSLDLPGSFGWYDALDVSGTMAVVGRCIYGTFVVDLGDPGNLVQIGHLATPAYSGIQDCAIIGDTVYSLGSDRFVTMAINSNGLHQVEEVVVPTEHTDAAISDHLLAVVSTRGALTLLDVSDPASPEVLHMDNRNDTPLAIELDPPFAYLLTQSRLVVMDVSLPLAPLELGSCEAHSWGREMAKYGDYLFFVSRYSGLRVIDVSDPMSPMVIAELPDCFGEAISVAGGFAFVADRETGIETIDIENPSAPVSCGQWYKPGSWIRDVLVTDGLFSEGILYAACGLEGLRVLDISDPCTADELTSLSVGLHRLALRDDLLLGTMNPCCGDPPVGRLFEVSQIGQPVEVGEYSPSIYPVDLIAGAHFFFTLGQRFGLTVIDPGDPVPVAVSGLNIDQAHHGVRLSWQAPEAAPESQRVALGEGNGDGFLAVSSLGGGLFGAIDTRPWGDGEQGRTYGVCLRTGSGLWQVAATGEYRRPLMEFRGITDVRPNPFNAKTRISFEVDRSMQVKLSIFDLSGKLVTVLADRIFAAGQHDVAWNGRAREGGAVASGTYFVRLSSEERVGIKKILLVK